LFNSSTIRRRPMYRSSLAYSRRLRFVLFSMSSKEWREGEQLDATEDDVGVDTNPTLN
jgi:hypothetical protein